MTADPDINPTPMAHGPEKSVLSSLMKNPALLEEAAVFSQLFHLPAHRIILAEIEKDGQGFELVSFIERLAQAGNLEAVGGPAGITEIYTYAPNDAHLDKHIEILRDRYARRLQIQVASAADAAARDCTDDNYLDALAGPVTAVFDAAAAATPPKDSKALLGAFLSAYERRLTGEQQPMGIPTGIPEVDAVLRGLQPQQMGIISARTEGGKSTMATQIAGNLAAAGTGTLYLILERTEDSVIERSVIQQAGIHHNCVKDPLGWAEMQGKAKPEREVLIRIRDAVQKLGNGHFFARKPDNRKLATIVAEIRRHHRLHGIRVVFLDQIGLVTGPRNPGDNEESSLRRVSNTLQELAHELGITLIVMSQVNNEGETKNARAVEEDADWHLSIIQEMDRKKDNFRQHLHVLVAKDSHNGKGGTRLPLILCRDTLLFRRGVPDLPEEKPKRGRNFQSRFSDA